MDFALGLTPTGDGADLVFANGEISIDNTLQTAIIVSLMSDRRANDDDVLPDGGTDRRGWWADAYADPLPDGTPDLFGSRLWLYRRCTATNANAALIREAIEEALAWMIATNVAASITVTTQWASATALAITIVIAQAANAGTPPPTPFQAIWDATLGTLLPA